MAHVTLEELYYVCDCCYGFPCTEECDTCAAWCEGGLDPYDGCKHQETRTRFIGRSYRNFEAEEHDARYDGLFGYWDFTAGERTRICSYLEIDGHVYCDKRESETEVKQ